MSIKISEIVRELMIRDGNNSQMFKPKYNSYAKTVINDLKLFTFRDIKRAWIQIDPYTKSINLPDDNMILSTLSVEVDGCIIPLCYNSDAKKDDYIEVQESKCGCNSCGCTSPYCNSDFQQTEEEITLQIPINRYADIINANTGDSACTECDLTEGSLPTFEYENQTFTKTTQTYVCANGDIVRKVCEPTIKYKSIVGVPIVYEDDTSACFACNKEYKRDDYVYDGVESVCTEDVLCSIVTKSCGCPESTAENNSLLEKYCGESSCNKRMGALNIYLEDNCRVHFPDDFAHTKVLVKYYENFNYTDATIPEFAREAVMTGIEYRMKLRERGMLGLARELKREYDAESQKVDMIVNRLRLGEFLDAILGNQKLIGNG